MQQNGNTKPGSGGRFTNQLAFFAENAPRSTDAETVLGPAEEWDQLLTAALSRASHSAFPLVVHWQSAGTFCNLPALQLLRGVPAMDNRHHLPPAGLSDWISGLNAGQPPQPLLVASEDRLVERHVKAVARELLDATGRQRGSETVLTPVTELAVKERAERMLRSIAEIGNEVVSARAAFQELVLRLAGNEQDFPFVALFRSRSSFSSSRLIAQAGFAFPPSSELVEAMESSLRDVSPWKRQEGRAMDIARHFAELPSGPWPLPPEQAYVFALPGRPGAESREWLALGLNRYAEDTQRYRELLESTRSAVSALISEVFRKEDRSARIKALAESNRDNARFNLQLLTELRTPLTLIVDESDAGSASDTVRASTRTLLRIVNAATDVTSLELEDVPQHPDAVDIAKHTAALVGMFQSALQPAGRALEFHCSHSPLIARVDIDLWEKLVGNLVTELVQASESARLALRLAKGPEGWFRLEAELADALTDPEKKGSTESISFRLVEAVARAHGGWIEERSSRRVRIRLPVTTAEGDSLLAEVPSATERGEAGAYLEELRFGRRSDEVVPREEHSYSVLVCDDHPEMLRFLKRILRSHFNVRTASDAATAMDSIARHRPDLVILDILLPGQSGLELLRELRTGSVYRDIPVLLVTAKADEQARMEGLAEGADGYLVKPFTTRTLLARVDNILRLRDLRAEIVRRETRARGEIGRLRAQCHGILDSINDAVVLLDEHLRIILLNRTAASAVERNEELLKGLHAFDAFPEARGTFIETKLREAVTYRRERHLDYQRPEDGRTYRMRFVPVAGGACVIARDVTERFELMRQVKESENRFRLVAHSAPVLIWMTDASGECTFVNAAWTRFTGRPAVAFLGNGWSQFVHADDLPAVLEALSVALEKHSAFEATYRMQNADNEYRWLITAAVPRFDRAGRFLGFIGSAVDITRERAAHERDIRMLQSLRRDDDAKGAQDRTVDEIERKLQESMKRLKTLSRRLLHSQEADHARLSRELHDQVGQALTGVKLTLRALSQMPLHEVVERRVKTAMSQLDDIVRQVRELSTSLRPVMLDELGLLPAVRAAADQFARQGGVEISVDGTGLRQHVDKETAITCFRIFQTALTNVLRHADARHVKVRLKTEKDWLIAKIEDDGGGFDVHEALRESYRGASFGLLSMQERAEFAGGSLQIESRPDAGTVVVARLPIAAGE